MTADRNPGGANDPDRSRESVIYTVDMTPSSIADERKNDGYTKVGDSVPHGAPRSLSGNRGKRDE